MTRITMLAVAALVLSGCRSESPTPEPGTAVVALTYAPSAEPADCSAPSVVECSGFCAHHGAPAQHVVSTTWDEQARLEPCAGGYCTMLMQVPVGRDVAVFVYDIAQCCRDCSSAVRENVYANGTRLVRFGAGGLAFRVSGRGVVTPGRRPLSPARRVRGGRRGCAPRPTRCRRGSARRACDARRSRRRRRR